MATPEIPPEVVAPLISPAERTILMAAAGGSIISLFFARQPFTWKAAAGAISCGLICAFYGVKLVAAALKLDPGYYGALGAAFGFLAMTVLGGVYKLVSMFQEDPVGFLERINPFFKKGGSP